MMIRRQEACWPILETLPILRRLGTITRNTTGKYSFSNKKYQKHIK